MATDAPGAPAAEEVGPVATGPRSGRGRGAVPRRWAGAPGRSGRPGRQGVGLSLGGVGLLVGGPLVVAPVDRLELVVIASGWFAAVLVLGGLPIAVGAFTTRGRGRERWPLVSAAGVFWLTVVAMFLDHALTGGAAGWWARGAWIVAALVVLAAQAELRPADLGLTLRLRRGRWWWFAALAVLALLSGTASVLTGEVGLEQQLIEWPWNPLAEELLWRGVLLALLVRAFGSPWRVLGVPCGWGAVSVLLLFTACHFVGVPGDSLESLRIDVDQPVGIVSVLMWSAAFWWLVAWTGSIWPSVVVHALSNSVPVPDAYEIVGLPVIASIVWLVVRRGSRGPRRPRRGAGSARQDADLDAGGRGPSTPGGRSPSP